MAFEPKVFNHGNAGQTRQERKLPKLIERVRDLSLESLAKLFAQMMDTADDTLFDLADKASNNKDQSMYFDAMRELRIKRKGMENVFRQELHHSFLSLAGSDASDRSDEMSSAFSLDNLSLVKEDELEENLAVDAMVNKAKTSNEEALRHLARRFDAVVPNCSVEPDDLPIYPKRICESFRAASATLGLDLKARLVVYKLFERSVIANLADVFDDLNNFLADNGVLPDLHLRKPKKRTTPQAPARRAARSEESTQRDSAEFNDEPVDIKAEVFSALRELLSVQKTGSASISDGGFGVPVVPMVETPQLLNALSLLQHDSRTTNVQQNVQPVDLRAALATRLPVVVGAVDAKAVGAVNDDVIDIVSMMFDFILGDQNLPDDIKAQLGRLQIPLLKVALVDKTFFSNRNHSARILLNEMAYAGIGWDPERRGRDGLQGKIEELVQRVLSEFDQDVNLFTSLLEEFRSYVEEERRRSAIIERRTKEAEEGKALSDSAKSTVDRVLERVQANRQLPDIASRLLKNVWSKVLFLEHIRSGPESEAFNDAVKLAETLVESVIIKTLADRAKLPSMIPGIVRKLKAGFETISYGTIESTTMLQELESLHLHLMRAPVTPEPIVESVLDDVVDAPSQKAMLSNVLTETDILADQLPDTNDDDAALLAAFNIDPALNDEQELDEIVLSSEPKKDMDLDGYLSQVDSLPIGSWLEIRDSGKPQRCKLAARIPSVGKLIFVNRSGVKVAEYTRPGLAVALRRDSAKLLDDAALFDRALEAVISNLRRLKDAAEA